MKTSLRAHLGLYDEFIESGCFGYIFMFGQISISNCRISLRFQITDESVEDKPPVIAGYATPVSHARNAQYELVPHSGVNANLQTAYIYRRAHEQLSYFQKVPHLAAFRCPFLGVPKQIAWEWSGVTRCRPQAPA